MYPIPLKLKERLIVVKKLELLLMLITLMELIEKSKMSLIDKYSSLIEPRDVTLSPLNLKFLLDITKN